MPPTSPRQLDADARLRYAFSNAPNVIEQLTHWRQLHIAREHHRSQRLEQLDLARSRWAMEKEALAAAREEFQRAQEAAERAKSDLVVRVVQHSDARSGA